jgi:hypothetical protein
MIYRGNIVRIVYEQIPVVTFEIVMNLHIMSVQKVNYDYPEIFPIQVTLTH